MDVGGDVFLRGRRQVAKTVRERTWIYTFAFFGRFFSKNYIVSYPVL